VSLLHFHIFAFYNSPRLLNFSENNWKECQRVASAVLQVSQFRNNFTQTVSTSYAVFTSAAVQ